MNARLKLQEPVNRRGLRRHAAEVTSAVLTSHAYAFGNLPVQFYGLGMDNKWKILRTSSSPVLVLKGEYRHEASRFLKRCGISYIIAPTRTVGVATLGKTLVDHSREYGLEDIAQYGDVHLLRVP